MQNKNSLKKSIFDVCIFDIDNVIIDTRSSYTDCIRRTVQHYLESVLQYRASTKSLLSRQDVEQFKLLGGFNDDWDTCYGLLTYFLSLNSPSKSIDDLIKKKKISSIKRGGHTSLGLKGMVKQFGSFQQISMHKIEDIFQSFYWCTFIKKETPVLPSSIFRSLKQSGLKIAIATGRNRREANYVFKRYGISRFIDMMITLDHLPHPKFKKPNPYSLTKIIKTLGRNLRYVYVGDLPDDVRMASQISNRYDIEGWGFNGLSMNKTETRRSLAKAGASKIIPSSARLRKVLLSF